MRYCVLAYLVLIGFLCGSARHAGADDLEGRWKVQSFTTETYILNSQERIKGPTVVKPENMWIQVGSGLYTLTNDGKETRYTLKKSVGRYILTRRAEEGTVVIYLSQVKRTADQLTFTTTRSNVPRKERTVVRMVCVPANRSSASPLVGTKWALVEILYNDDKVLKPYQNEPLTVEFGAKGLISGRAGINHFNGSCKAEKDGSFSVSQMTMTRAMNPPGSIADPYMQELQRASRFLLQDGKLILLLPFDTGAMVFRRLS
jgi:heat shock protein HslJ